MNLPGLGKFDRYVIENWANRMGLYIGNKLDLEKKAKAEAEAAERKDKEDPKKLEEQIAQLKKQIDALKKIKCINKSDSYNPHERILSIGGTNPDGTRWKLSQQDAIAGIERGELQFCVRVGEKSAWIIIALSAQGRKYLKTKADGEQPNSLLSLPECP